MNTGQFKSVYAVMRNGANGFFRHPLVRKFQYSDGVQELAETGCYWLLDVIATEFCKPLTSSGEYMGIIKVSVTDSNCAIEMTVDDDKPAVYAKMVGWTDMPEGEWNLYLADEGERYALILPTEY